MKEKFDCSVTMSYYATLKYCISSINSSSVQSEFLLSGCPCVTVSFAFGLRKQKLKTWVKRVERNENLSFQSLVRDVFSARKCNGVMSPTSQKQSRSLISKWSAYLNFYVLIF